MSKKGLFWGCLLLAPWFAQAQVRIQLELPFAHQMPASLSEWEHNEALIRIFISNTTPTPLEQLHIAGYLEWEDGRRLASIVEGHRAQPRFSLEPGETRSFSWRELINPEALDYDRTWVSRVATSGTLPEGGYQLCLQVLDAKGQRLGQTEPCGQLSVILPDPPQLLSPADGAVIHPTQSLPLFQWTPTTPQLPGTTYRLIIKPVFANQSPDQALQANPLLFQHETSATSYQYLPSDPDLGQFADAQAFVWQVQALMNGQPYGRNHGLSALATFSLARVEATATSDTSFAPPAFDLLAWEVPYEALLAGRPVKLVASLPPQSKRPVLYRLRLRMPQTLTAEQLALLLGQQQAPTDTLVVDAHLIAGATPDQMPAIGSDPRGGYYAYRLSPDSTQPAVLVGWTDQPFEAARQIAYNAGKEGAITVERRNGTQEAPGGRLMIYEAPGHPVGIIGTFIPTSIFIPLLDLELEGENPPVCDLPTLEGDASIATARYTGYVLNQAVASGAGRASGKTLGAVTRQAPPQQGQGRGVLLPKPSEVGLPDFRQAPTGNQPPIGGQSPEECPPNAKCAPPTPPFNLQQATALDEADDGVVICWLPTGDPQNPTIGVIGMTENDAVIFQWPGRRATVISAVVKLITE